MRTVWNHVGLRIESYRGDDGLVYYVLNACEVQLAENDYQNMLARLMMDSHSIEAAEVRHGN